MRFIRIILLFMLGGTAMSSCQAMGMDDGEAFIDACSRGRLDVVRNLSNRVDINTHNWQGETGLMQAAFQGKNDIVEYLLNCGADPLLKNSHGKTALDYAIQSGAPEADQAAIVTMMLNAAEAHSGAVEGAGGEAAKKNFGDVIVDALVSAVEKNKFEIVKILLAKKPEFLHVFRNLAERAQRVGRWGQEFSKISEAANFLLSLRNAQLRAEDPEAGVCEICMESNSFGIGAEVALPLCGHYLCNRCMERSRQKAHEREEKKADEAGRGGLAVVGYCPTCRKIFDTPAFVFRLQEVPNLQDFLQQAASPVQEKKEEAPAEERKEAPPAVAPIMPSSPEELARDLGSKIQELMAHQRFDMRMASELYNRLTENAEPDYIDCWTDIAIRKDLCRARTEQQVIDHRIDLLKNALRYVLGELHVSVADFSWKLLDVSFPGAEPAASVPQLSPLIAAPVHAQPASRPAPHIDIVRLQKVQKQELQRGVARDVWHDMKMHRDRRLSDIFNKHWATVFSNK